MLQSHNCLYNKIVQKSTKCNKQKQWRKGQTKEGIWARGRISGDEGAMGWETAEKHPLMRWLGLDLLIRWELGKNLEGLDIDFWGLGLEGFDIYVKELSFEGWRHLVNGFLQNPTPAILQEKTENLCDSFWEGNFQGFYFGFKTKLLFFLYSSV